MSQIRKTPTTKHQFEEPKCVSGAGHLPATLLASSGFTYWNTLARRPINSRLQYFRRKIFLLYFFFLKKTKYFVSGHRNSSGFSLMITFNLIYTSVASVNSVARPSSLQMRSPCSSTVAPSGCRRTGDQGQWWRPRSLDPQGLRGIEGPFSLRVAVHCGFPPPTLQTAVE